MNEEERLKQEAADAYKRWQIEYRTAMRHGDTKGMMFANLGYESAMKRIRSEAQAAGIIPAPHNTTPASDGGDGGDA